MERPESRPPRRMARPTMAFLALRPRRALSAYGGAGYRTADSRGAVWRYGAQATTPPRLPPLRQVTDRRDIPAAATASRRPRPPRMARPAIPLRALRQPAMEQALRAMEPAATRLRPRQPRRRPRPRLERLLEQGPAYDQRSSNEAAATAPTTSGGEAATGAASSAAAYPTTGYAASQPATTPPTTTPPTTTMTPPAAATASYPAVPSSLATDGSSYRPGSTAGGYGVQNAAYSQPAATTATSPAAGSYNPAGPSTYGNTYTR